MIYLAFFSLLIKRQTQTDAKIADTATSTGSTGIGQTSVLMSFKSLEQCIYTEHREDSKCQCVKQSLRCLALQQITGQHS